MLLTYRQLSLALPLLTLPLACADEDTGESNSATPTSTASTDSTSDGGTRGSDNTTESTPDTATSEPATTTGQTTTTGEGDTTGDMTGATDTDTGVKGSTVSGIITSSVGNDLTGTLYLGLLESCAADAATAVAIQVEAADLSAGFAYQIDAVPDGTYYLNGFLDTNENSPADAPCPDVDDIVAASFTDPLCTEVVVTGSDVSGVHLELNLVVNAAIVGLINC